MALAARPRNPPCQPPPYSGAPQLIRVKVQGLGLSKGLGFRAWQELLSNTIFKVFPGVFCWGAWLPRFGRLVVATFKVGLLLPPPYDTSPVLSVHSIKNFPLQRTTLTPSNAFSPVLFESCSNIWNMLVSKSQRTPI